MTGGVALAKATPKPHMTHHMSTPKPKMAPKGHMGHTVKPKPAKTHKP